MNTSIGKLIQHSLATTTCIHSNRISYMIQKIVFILSILFVQVPNNYETDLIYPIIEKASELANVSYELADDRSKMNLKVC